MNFHFLISSFYRKVNNGLNMFLENIYIVGNIYYFMKPLKPSNREKKRYLLVRGKNLNMNIEKAILDFIGVLGMSKCGLSWIKSEKDSAVICVNRKMVDSVRASLCVWPEKISVEKVSGTIRGLSPKNL